METIETSVVVVGYGGAGAAAAITAYDCGADVTILEKMPIGGGNTRISGGSIALPLKKEYIQYLERLTFNNTPRDVLERFVDESLRTDDWIKELGGELVRATYLRVSIPPITEIGWRHIPGAEYGIRKHVKGKGAAAPDDPPGERLWNLLSNNVEHREIKVLTETPVSELITSPNGEVIGVVAKSMGKEISVMAKKGIVLACGGFEYNDSLKWDYLPAKPVFSNGNPGNTGDGIKMAQKIGADLWHMSNLSCIGGFKAPEYEATFHIKLYSENFIFVDKYGKRFADEAGIDVHDYGRMFSYFDAHKIEYPRIPIYLIFDEVLRRRAPLWDGVAGYNRGRYKWSLDNSEEIRKGWITQAKTMSQLADKIPLDRANLENTVKKYNEHCKAGRDSDFGRAKEYLGPLMKPPYYAIKLWPALFNTQGGPRRDKEARVLNVEGKPIPRLYAAGELGAIWGVLYQGGSNIAEALAFGRIAGRNAAGEKPWR
mgnify:CR=1 FL=1